MPAETICRDLDARLDQFKTRYGYPPKDLPITLDEWVWLGEAASYYTAFLHGSSKLLVPTHYAGVQLRLVSSVTHRDGTVRVKP